MQQKPNQLWRIFYFYGGFYLLLQVGYILFIHLMHSTYNVVSISFIMLPFIAFLLFQWSLWKKTEQNRRRKQKSTFAGIALIGSAPVLICMIMLGVNEGETHFTSEKWMQDDTGKRVYMVDDLLTDHEIGGKTREEVFSLLGEPTITEYFKNDNNIVYHLGNERGLISIDSEWLVIDFDKEDKVKKYAVVTD
ncbi:outer membrane protein assembly factor BamE domain-containing protein [Virgibacillus halodenitrificans]|uniref:outer membrane protein assembly factor BamE domain-containing protein n=1 Tax=Virgibacillus halodenitrificans TaxID=1482 RepID=UPI0002D57BF2|nr:outer membrane protein assembly factor BamE [Virgibacillus halodenitrificans]MCG1028510.1 outer membrane protein assembly factor BamE [Virgibacillus halodenitrificans]MEC2158761.1 outer membrane protein assembly factor BamE [Virgibacillus halodenitrificans]